jgi:hypothetical protein
MRLTLAMIPLLPWLWWRRSREAAIVQVIPAEDLDLGGLRIAAGSTLDVLPDGRLVAAG